MMYRKYSKGIIEVITGPMFAGKSEELIRRIRLFGHAGENVLVVKPSIDTRWTKNAIKSRAGSKVDTIVIDNALDILTAFKKSNYDVIAIDEAQFFDKKLISVAKQFADSGVRVIISALDTDFSGKPFGSIPSILAMAENVQKLAAVCFKCGNAATHTYRKTNSKETVVVGNEEYEARCRECHVHGTLYKTQEIKVK